MGRKHKRKHKRKKKLSLEERIIQTFSNVFNGISKGIPVKALQFLILDYYCGCNKRTFKRSNHWVCQDCRYIACKTEFYFCEEPEEYTMNNDFEIFSLKDCKKPIHKECLNNMGKRVCGHFRCEEHAQTTTWCCETILCFDCARLPEKPCTFCFWGSIRTSIE